jgi:glutaredoxin
MVRPGITAARWAAALLAVVLLAVAGVASAAGQEVTVHVFWGEGCPHCERALDFLARQQAADPELKVARYEIRHDEGNRARFRELARHFGIARPGVPLIVIGDRHYEGYHDDEFSGRPLMQHVAECRRDGCPDIVAVANPATGSPGAAGPAFPAPPASPASPTAVLPEVLDVPLLGPVATRELSLPAVTVLLAAIDGFNPCAMWTLVLLIGLLIGQPDRVRMWFLGSLFIAGSALVYLLFLTTWLNALLALGDLGWVRVLVGAVALAGGAWYLKEFVANPGAACKVTAPEPRRRVIDRLKALALEPRLLVAAAGILALAFVVNLVELVCSAGIPAVFTQILALHALSAWHYAAYLLLYVAVFMFDDLVVFVVAMSTLHLAGIGTRYVRASRLIGGIVLLAVGFALIFRPQWLLFG